MAGGSKNPDSRRNFILQQGLDAPAQEGCPVRFSALMFQPRLIGSFVLLAIILQSPAIFLVLSGILWWNVLIPRLNPFDAAYNRTLANRPGGVRLEPAPPPRRFAQGMAGSFALAIGMLLPLPETPFSSRKKRLFERGLRSNRLPAHESDRSIPKISAL